MGATISNTIVRPNEGPQRATVSIQLLWDTDLSPVARNVDQDLMVKGVYSVPTDEDGYWEAEVITNEDILPADSVYKITETLNSQEEGNVYYISVPNAATPTFWTGDILVATPEWV